MAEAAHRLQDSLSGRYHIERELGRGGMAAVYLADDLKHHRSVAIKVLDPELAAAIGAERFLREIQIAARLNHPQILPLHDSGAAEGLLYYVMPYVEGESLRERLTREKQLPIAEAVTIACEVAAALTYAHRQGFIHRDIKPENILLSQGHPLLADFGIARAVSAAGREKLTRTGVAVGTPVYMSPEQAGGASAIDGRSDLYSLGCVLYEMLAGQPPFTGPSVESIVHQHLAVPPPLITNLRPSTPVGISGLLERVLAKVPADRYASGEEFARALKEALTEPEPKLVSVQSKGRARRSARFAVPAALAAAVLVVAAGGWMLLRGVHQVPGRIESLAVLPLENLSGDPQQEFFADGMTEELINRLAQIGALRVTSRSSAMMFKGTKQTIPEIARRLKVDAVIEGSVRRAGDRVRVTVQLVHAATDKNLWSSSYERDAGDVFALQSEAAQDIAGQIHGVLTPQERTRLAAGRHVDPAAHEAYLKGRYELAKGLSSSAKALEYFGQATDLDPTYALAYVGAADSYVGLANRGYLAPDQALAKARAAALKALELDPTLGAAHNSLGSISMNAWDWRSAEREHRRAIAMNPGYADGHERLSVLLAYLGRDREAMIAVTRALQLNPVASQPNANVGLFHYYARRFDQAIEALRKALELDPTNASAYLHLAWVYPERGMHNEAIAAAQKYIALAGPQPDALSALGYAYAEAGNRTQAQKLLRDLEDRSKHEYVAPYELAIVCVGLGETEQALAWLEQGFRRHDPKLRRLKVDRKFDPLRTDPRFQDLLRRIGLSP